MNYNHSKPYVPPPPSLPRFSLPSDGTGEDAPDPLDAAATAERPAVRGARPRPTVRRRRPAADATEEVQVEDILLEVYAEEPPPPLRGAPAVAHGEAVDALLRASDPALLAYAPPQAPYASSGAHGQGQAGPMMRGDETPSVSPMMLATTRPPPPPPARPVLASASRRGRSRGLAIAMWGAVIMVLGVCSGAALVMGARNGTYARVVETVGRARSAAARPATTTATATEAPATAVTLTTPASPPPATPAAPAAEATAEAPAEATAAEATAEAPAAPAPEMPTVSVDALPKPAVPAGFTLVRFPDYAQGHRVYVDGRTVRVADGSPTKLRCGRHLIKIGTAHKARVTYLACGREITLR